MYFKFKDKHGVDPRLIQRRKARGLDALPELEISEPEIIYPGRIYCPACEQWYTISPLVNEREAMALHAQGCRRMKRDLIVVRGK